MALILKDRVKETSTSVGTGSFTLAGATTGYQSFSVIGNANTTYYCIAGQGTGEWEVGVGTYTLSGTTLSRDTILSSSNSGSAVNFSAGIKDVFVVYPAERSVNYNQAGTGVDITGALDLTNLEVTNIKAKDGTASATIADSTGVMTIGSSVLTTTDINGGTIDGAVIGGSSAAAGSFTTLTCQSPFIVTGTNIGAGSSIWFGSDANGGGAINVPTGEVFLGLVNQAEVIRYSSTGLAVTGALSASGNGSFNTGGGTQLGLRLSDYTAGGVAAIYNGANANNSSNYSLASSTTVTYINGSASSRMQAGAVDVAVATSTGLAVTGTISASNGITNTEPTGAAVISTVASTGTNEAYFGAANTGGSYYFGAENSAGTWFGASAYALAISAPAGRVIDSLIGGTKYSTLSSTGLAVTGEVSATTAIKTADATTLYWGAGSAYIQGSSASSYVAINTGSTQRGLFNSSGLAVTGALSATQNLSIDSGGVTAYASPSAHFLRNHGGQSYTNNAGLDIYWNTSNGSGESELVFGNLSTSYLRFIHNNAGAFAEIARVSSTGLAVTGAIGATVSSGYAYIAARASGGDKLRITPLVAGGGTTIDVVNAAESDYEPLYFVGETVSLNVRTGVGTFTQVGEFSSTGLSVTGAISSTNTIDISKAVAGSLYGLNINNTQANALGLNAAISLQSGATANQWEIYASQGSATASDSTLIIAQNGVLGNILTCNATTGVATAGAFTAYGNITAVTGTITTGSTTALSLATSGGTQAKFNNVASTVNWHNFFGAPTGNNVIVIAAGETNVGYDVATKGTGAFRVFTGCTTDSAGSAVEQLRITHTASAVNYLTLTGSSTGNPLVISAAGSDTDIAATLVSKGAGNVRLSTGSASNIQVLVSATASANRYITLTGSNGGSPVIGTSAGDLAISTNLNVNAQITTTYDAGANLLTIRSSTQPVLRLTDDGTTNIGDFTIVSGAAILRTITNTPLAFLVNSSEIVRLSANGLSMTTGYIEGAEQTAPAAPASNGYRIYAEDNGAGKTRLMVKFATGAAQQIAIEP